MSIASSRSLATAWATLAAITIISVYTAEVAPWRLLAVAMIMAIAALKGVLILWRFMEVDTAPAGIRLYMVGWTVFCAAMIFAGYWGALE